MHACEAMNDRASALKTNSWQINHARLDQATIMNRRCTDLKLTDKRKGKSCLLLQP